ncbi:MAG: hypothetical protein ACI4PF_00335 [Christensenellales bacterium]
MSKVLEDVTSLQRKFDGLYDFSRTGFENSVELRDCSEMALKVLRDVKQFLESSKTNNVFSEKSDNVSNNFNLASAMQDIYYKVVLIESAATRGAITKEAASHELVESFSLFYEIVSSAKKILPLGEVQPGKTVAPFKTEVLQKLTESLQNRFFDSASNLGLDEVLKKSFVEKRISKTNENNSSSNRIQNDVTKLIQYFDALEKEDITQFNTRDIDKLVDDLRLSCAYEVSHSQKTTDCPYVFDSSVKAKKDSCDRIFNNFNHYSNSSVSLSDQLASELQEFNKMAIDFMRPVPNLLAKYHPNEPTFTYMVNQLNQANAVMNESAKQIGD